MLVDGSRKIKLTYYFFCISFLFIFAKYNKISRTFVRFYYELIIFAKDMRIIGISRLMKLKVKNRGNSGLCSEIDKLITDIGILQSNGPFELKRLRKDADCVHDDGFYFFDIHLHRTLVLIQFDEENTATIVWVGNHQDYEKTFKNNKKVIEKWLRSKSYI